MTRRTSAMIGVVLAVLLAMPAALGAGQADVKEARQGTAQFHQVANAVKAGYGSTLDSLGCFEDPVLGGMGLHYLHEGLLLDGVVDARTPEALVYEMTANGKLKLAGVEYIVPVDLWADDDPPELFSQHFHENEALGLWVLHAWIWTPNPSGMFEDWNPSVARCPDGVPIFGS